MNIVIGRGRNRKAITIPSGRAACNKVTLEQNAEDLKAFLFRPATLNKRNKT